MPKLRSVSSCWILPLLGVCWTMVAACGAKHLATKTEVLHERVEVIAVVLSYEPNAVSDQFDDGTVQSFDITRVLFEAPASLRGQERAIAHDSAEPPNSPWRRTGATLVFWMDPALLGSDSLPFSAAAEELHVLDP